MKINTAKHLITMHELMMPKETNVFQALEVALDCMTFVQNINAVYNAQDANEATIYVVQDIIEKFFAKDGELC